MKILLSAYACEPNKGSEPGVGWSWAIEYAKYHQVWVLTRDNNEPTIREYLQEKPEYNNENLHFIYVGLSKKLTFWKKGRRGMRLFYMFWQRKAAKVAEEWNSKIGFDLVQHVTFVSYTQPTYMYKLGIPLIWGPVSGGENIPAGIKISMSGKEKCTEIIRKLSQYAAISTSSLRRTMKKAKLILVTTEETKKRIPEKYRDKIRIMPAIGLEELPSVSKRERYDEKVRIIMAGRLIYWKAFDIGIKAFMQIADQFPNAELHILGEGNRKETLKSMAGSLLDKQIFFEDPVSHDSIYDFYSRYDIYLNTTLRDSGCMAMMEAMSVGLPCIAIATGGPNVLLHENEWAKIQVNNHNNIIEQIKEKLIFLFENREFANELGQQQKRFIEKNLLMQNKYEVIQMEYKERGERHA